MRVRHTIPILVLGLALVLAACSSDDDSSSAATTTTAPATTTTAAPATVKVVTNPTLGQILVNANGLTLYLFEKDTGTTTACTGNCAGVWPALAAPSPSAGTGLDAAKLTIAAGQVPNQVVYNGHLLYTYAPDTAPGDVKGASIPSWFAVGPDGNKVVKA